MSAQEINLNASEQNGTYQISNPTLSTGLNPFASPFFLNIVNNDGPSDNTTISNLPPSPPVNKEVTIHMKPGSLLGSGNSQVISNDDQKVTIYMQPGSTLYGGHHNNTTIIAPAPEETKQNGELDLLKKKLADLQLALEEAQKPCSGKVAGVNFAAEHGVQLTNAEGVCFVTYHFKKSKDEDKLQHLKEWQQEHKKSGVAKTTA